MANFLLIGCDNTHGLAQGFETLAAAIKAAAGYRRNPATIPAIDDNEWHWIGEVTDHIQFGDRDAVYEDHEGGISLWVIQSSCLPGKEPPLSPGDAAALERAKLAEASLSH